MKGTTIGMIATVTGSMVVERTSHDTVSIVSVILASLVLLPVVLLALQLRMV